MPLEPSSHPIWVKLAKQLASIVDSPMEAADLLTRARKRFGWAVNVANNVLAYTDGRFLYFANGRWHRYSHPLRTEERPEQRHNKSG